MTNDYYKRRNSKVTHFYVNLHHHRYLRFTIIINTRP